MLQQYSVVVWDTVPESKYSYAANFMVEDKILI